jgi:hypothetical protein
MPITICATLLALLAACTNSDDAALATISGRLLAVGGPAPGTARPLPGTVTLENTATHSTTLLRVGQDGRYTTSVGAGTYKIVGHSPLYGSGKYECKSPKTVTTAANAKARADVFCEEV